MLQQGFDVVTAARIIPRTSSLSEFRACEARVCLLGSGCAVGPFCEYKGKLLMSARFSFCEGLAGSMPAHVLIVLWGRGLPHA